MKLPKEEDEAGKMANASFKYSLYRRHFLPRSKKTRPSSRSRVYFCTTGALGDHLPTQLSTSFLIKTEHMGSPGKVCNLKWLITPKIQAIGNGGKSSKLERKPGINSLESEIKN